MKADEDQRELRALKVVKSRFLALLPCLYVFRKIKIVSELLLSSTGLTALGLLEHTNVAG